MSDVYDSTIRQMVADTEKEVFWEGIGEQEPTDHENQLVDELSQPEGWDGDDLGIEEIAARTMDGDNPQNFDRPVQMDNEITLSNKLAAAEQQRDAALHLYDEHVAAPTRELQRTAHREQVRQNLENQYGMFGFDDAKLDQFIADHSASVQHAQALQSARIEASMAAAHQKYGDDFLDAYNDLTAMKPDSALARDIVQTMVSTSDPGEALMQLHGNSLVRALGPSRSPPFMPRSWGPPHASRPTRSSAAMDAGWGDQQTEQDVFNSAFDDEGY
jgi:hypothetical protein